MTDTVTYEIHADMGSLQVVDHPEARTYRFERDHPELPLVMMLSTAGTPSEDTDPIAFHTFKNAKVTITIEAQVAQ